MNVIELFKEKELDILKTLWYNFKYLPFEQAKKLPIYLYGKVSVPPLSKTEYKEHVVLQPTFISQGMVKIGCYKSSLFGEKLTHQTILNVRGKWIIKGSFMLSNGATLAIAESGTFETGHDVAIGPCAKIYCVKSIKLGKRIRASWDVQMFDTNFHYTIKNDFIAYNKGRVNVGDHCWIANRVSLMPNTNLPNYSVVASNSLVNKDYSGVEEKSLFAGSPAKYIFTGIQRLFADAKTESLIDKLFDDTSKDSYNIFDPEIKSLLKMTLNYKDGVLYE